MKFATLARICTPYLRHMTKHPKSLLSRFLGLYSVRMYGQVQYLVVMNNLFYTSRLYKINERYDLKGSKVNRSAKKVPGKTPTLKDNDFYKQIFLTRSLAQDTVQQLKLDSQFLRDQNIMDYSLLVGIHNCIEPTIQGSHCNALPDQPQNFGPNHIPHTPTNETKRNSTLTVQKQSTRASNTSRTSSESTEVTIQLEDFNMNNSQNNTEGGELPTHTPPVTTDLTPPTSPTQLSLHLPSQRTSHLNASGRENRSPSAFVSNVKHEPFRASVIIGPGIYHLGIIDILQDWNLRKRLEHIFKRYFLFHFNDYSDLSVVEPHYYSERFGLMLDRAFSLTGPQ